MSTPQQPGIEALALYRVPFVEEELRIQFQRAYFATNAFRDAPSSAHEIIERCLPLVLIDVVITNVDDRFTADDFAQEMEGFDSPQVAYDEAVSSTEGQLLERKQGCADHRRNGRILFYLHYYDPSRPIRWTYGEFRCPDAQIIPEALWKLMPYNPID